MKKKKKQKVTRKKNVPIVSPPAQQTVYLCVKRSAQGSAIDLSTKKRR